ncbi:MAG: SDR family oxidoreductase [bacterium]
MRFKDKVVIVTGSAKGIGAELIRKYASEGANVVINYINSKSEAESLKEEIENLNLGKVIIVKADVSKKEEAKLLVDTTLEEFGTIDILVNNAGRYFDGDEWDLNENAWKETLDNNLISVMNISKFVIQYFIENKKGSILNIASRMGLNSKPDAIAYSASKAGIINITTSYAKLISEFGNCNCICPGATKCGYWLRASETELEDIVSRNPKKRLVNPKEIAELGLFLTSDTALMITGQTILVDGGESLS